ncbi:MAG: hypothetical protein H0V01_12325 [Bacteroidetes bacterium]|nr:hypothetical protein [Bacteroidota bacterium]HET6245846.1 hypothetical protein [Bacteroidia bacterium]
MKNTIIPFVFLLFFNLFGNLVHSKITSGKGIIILEGKYQNKNLYVQNSFASSGVGFCVYEVTINGKVTTDPINSSAFEIDFNQEMIAVGTDVIVEIKHKDGCSPKVLNPDVLKPMPTFETTSIKVNHDGIINWSTKNETGSLPYYVEHFKWNKWVNVGEVQGKGTPEENAYSFKIPLVSGENKFRVKQLGNNNKPRYSEEIKLRAKMTQVSYSYSKSSREIVFSSETSYEIYDKYGNLAKKGYGKVISCTNLEKAVHYLNYDSSTEEISLK